MQKILVTGGAGFIGSNYIRYLLRQHNDVAVINLDKLTYAGNLDNLREFEKNPRYRFVQGDICDDRLVNQLAAEVEAVVNFAAESHVDRSITGSSAFIDTNINGTYTLLEAARSYWNALPAEKKQAFRFLHVSTDEVYGSLGDEGLFREDTPYDPSSPYSASKAASDHLVLAWHRTYGFPALISNCSNNYGPYQFPEKLIPLMILNARDGKPLPVYGDGRNVRDWSYVDDHCRGILRALDDGVLGEQYAFGADDERSNLAVVDAICDALEAFRPARSNPRLRDSKATSYRELKRFVPDRPGHDFRYAIDASKARRELAWRPEMRFEAGLESTVAWYVENEAWRRSIEASGDLRQRQGLTTDSPGRA